MIRAMIGCLLLVALSSGYIQVPNQPAMAEQTALEHLESLGVLLPVAVTHRDIAAPVSGYLVDFLGYQGEVLTAFRVGVTDSAEGNPGEVFVVFSHGSDGTWSPALDSSPEELLAYEFLLDDREEFMALALGPHPMITTAPPSGTILTTDGPVTAVEMLAALNRADLVFVGEQHDDPLAHEWELFIWTALGSADRALALEMLETDVQPLLDQYLSGAVTREDFIAGSRPWSNYQQDYEPLVAYAVERCWRVIAANVPRSFASMVAMGGNTALVGTEFEGIAIDSSNTSYHTRFLETMDAVGSEMHGMPMDFENLYRAQLLKDAVMAGSVAGQRCVFICGRFHSDSRSGIPDQLPLETTIATVSILRADETVDYTLADFLIVP
jgi:uncharacterized iron-regulated protein